MLRADEARAPLPPRAHLARQAERGAPWGSPPSSAPAPDPLPLEVAGEPDARARPGQADPRRQPRRDAGAPPRRTRAGWTSSTSIPRSARAAPSRSPSAPAATARTCPRTATAGAEGLGAYLSTMLEQLELMQGAPLRAGHPLPPLRLARQPLPALPPRRGLRPGLLQERDRVALPPLAGQDARLPADARRPLLVRQEPGRSPRLDAALRAARREHPRDLGDQAAGRRLLVGPAQAEPDGRGDPRARRCATSGTSGSSPPSRTSASATRRRSPRPCSAASSRRPPGPAISSPTSSPARAPPWSPPRSSGAAGSAATSAAPPSTPRRSASPRCPRRPSRSSPSTASPAPPPRCPASQVSVSSCPAGASERPGRRAHARRRGRHCRRLLGHRLGS